MASLFASTKDPLGPFLTEVTRSETFGDVQSIEPNPWLCIEDYAPPIHLSLHLMRLSSKPFEVALDKTDSKTGASSW